MFYKIFYGIAFIMMYKDMYVYVKKYIVGENGHREKITIKELIKALILLFYHVIVLRLSSIAAFTNLSNLF